MNSNDLQVEEKILIRVRARLRLYVNGRSLPIRDSYRPLFLFGGRDNVSGYINLINDRLIELGTEANVYVDFVNSETNRKNIYLGRIVEFGEGPDLKVGSILIEEARFISVSSEKI